MLTSSTAILTFQTIRRHGNFTGFVTFVAFYLTGNPNFEPSLIPALTLTVTLTLTLTLILTGWARAVWRP